MEPIQWEIKKFSELTATELYELLRLRVDVFVVEQACPYPELDGKDILAHTLHLAARMAGGSLAAYLRILAPGGQLPRGQFGPGGYGQGLPGQGAESWVDRKGG